jgi:hypothetical protein
MAGRIWPQSMSSTQRDGRTEDLPSPSSWRARLEARCRAGRFDRLLSVGVPAAPGTGLALHAARLTSRDEREAIARALRRVVDDVRCPPNTPAALDYRIRPYRQNIRGAEDLIDAITLRLHAPLPVGVRGMARLRVVLSDGSGPLYRRNGGDLHGRLGAALAAL